jgi:hypothetical protein
MKEIFIDIEGHSGRFVDEPGIIAGICKDLNAEGVNIRAISCQVAKAGVSESKGNTGAVPSVAIAVEDEDAVNAHYVLKGMWGKYRPKDVRKASGDGRPSGRLTECMTTRELHIAELEDRPGALFEFADELASEGKNIRSMYCVPFSPLPPKCVIVGYTLDSDPPLNRKYTELCQQRAVSEMEEPGSIWSSE